MQPVSQLPRLFLIAEYGVAGNAVVDAGGAQRQRGLAHAFKLVRLPGWLRSATEAGQASDEGEMLPRFQNAVFLRIFNVAFLLSRIAGPLPALRAQAEGFRRRVEIFAAPQAGAADRFLHEGGFAVPAGRLLPFLHVISSNSGTGKASCSLALIFSPTPGRALIFSMPMNLSIESSVNGQQPA